MQARVLKAVTFSVFLAMLEAASGNAQAPSPPQTEARSPLSQIARDVSTWFSRVTSTDATTTLIARTVTDAVARTATHETNIRTSRAEHGTIEPYFRTSPAEE